MPLKRITALVLATGLLFVGPQIVSAQRRSTAETSLVGIRLFDTVYRLLDVYGNPDEIQSVGGGGGGGGGSAPAAIPQSAGIPSGGAPIVTAGGGGGRAGGGRFGGGVISPFSFGDEALQQRGGEGGGRQGRGGAGQGFPGGGGVQAAGPTVAAGSAPVSSINYTRWVYKRGGGKYGFVLDGGLRVIQIEAIGLENNKVKTRRGITFGATFAKVLRVYGLPDNYDVAGNSITMRYLRRDKVIFRLNRLGMDKPHVVTGVLVAAGQS